MPSLPKSRKRPWQPDRAVKPQTGRKIKNPFYQKMPWRNFRALQKMEAIEQSKQILNELMEKGEPIPPAFNTLQPLCAKCLKKTLAHQPRYTPARVLDHIKPINPADAYNTENGRYGEPLNPENVQWLCDMHHARKSGAEHQFHKK